MHKLLTRALMLSLLVTFSGVGASARQVLSTTAPQKVGLSSARLDRLDGAVETLVSNKQIPGAVTLIARHGKIAHFKALGMMDIQTGQAMRPDAIFRIYSMTKPIVSVAIMMLFEEGRIGLDDPVAKYIPEFENMRVYKKGATVKTMVTEDLARPVTIHDLLTHTSGLTYNFIGTTPVHKLYTAKGILPGGNELSPLLKDVRPIQSLQEMVEALETIPLLHQPGTRFSYGVSLDVLGYVVEKISGQTLDVFLKTRLFDPLGMKDTGFWVPQEKLDRLAALYIRQEDGSIKRLSSAKESRFTRRPSLLSGGGGLVSTAMDYVRFSQMLLNGGALDGIQILSPKTVELMTQNNLPDGVSMFGRPGYGFGLGFSVITDIVKTHNIGSTGTYSWSGAASTAFWIDPQEDMIIVAMTQVIGPQNSGLYDFMQRQAYQAVVN